MKTVDKNRISLRNFNKWYEDLTAEELIEEYNRLLLSDPTIKNMQSLVNVQSVGRGYMTRPVFIKNNPLTNRK